MIEEHISRNNFLENYYEKNYLLIKDVFKPGAVSWSDINSALFSWDPRDGFLRFFKDGPVPVENYTEQFIDGKHTRNRIIKDVFYDLLRDGATLVMNRLNSRSEAIHAITAQLAQYIGERAIANGYVAFGGEGGFGKHWDTHDVFAVQLIGKKKWKLFEPTFQLPLPSQGSKEHKDECPPTPTLETQLEAGDVLYIPRGWWHEATPIEGEETFHIAVGIHPPHTVDYIIWSCLNSAKANIDLRRSIKFEDRGIKSLESAIEALNEALLDEKNLEFYKNTVAQQERFASSFNIERAIKSNIEDLSGEFRINSSYSQNSNIYKNINGFSVSTENMNREALDKIFNQQSPRITFDEESIKNNNFLSVVSGLVKKDILSEIK